VIAYGKKQCGSVNTGAPALEIRGLSVSYPETQRLALHDINLCAQEGAQVALVGHNGAGKSTLLKEISGLLPVRKGSILVFGQPPGVCRRQIAYLSQRDDIDWHFPISLRRLVLTGRYVHLGWFKPPRREDLRIVDQVIEQLGLESLRDRQISELSGGQQQRALLARALAQEARLLLLDEPLNAVDDETRIAIGELLESLRRRDVTVLVATHDLERLKTSFDEVLHLVDGEATRPAPDSPYNVHTLTIGEAR